MAEAIKTKTWNHVKDLCEKGEKVPSKFLEWAAECGYLDLVEYLVSIDAEYSTDVMDLAANNGHLEVVKYLHSVGKKGRYALEWAMEEGRTEVVEYLTNLP